VANILHPDNGGKTFDVNFAAFGTAAIASRVLGDLTGQTSRTRFRGLTILQPNPSFWIIFFQIIPVQNEKYTLEIREQSSNKLLDVTGDIELPSIPPTILGGGAAGTLTVSYPQANTQVPSPFSAYGSSNQAGAIVGSIAVAPGSTCPQTTPPAPPTSWTMQCTVQNWDGNPATLTVSQPAAANPPPPVVVGNLTF
jgi:hypothetical protein